MVDYAVYTEQIAGVVPHDDINEIVYTRYFEGTWNFDNGYTGTQYFTEIETSYFNAEVDFSVPEHHSAVAVPLQDGFYLLDHKIFDVNDKVVLDLEKISATYFSPPKMLPFAFCKLKSNKYLLGYKSLGLYIVQGQTIKLLGNKLRNFRLRKLKKISTARK